MYTNIYCSYPYEIVYFMAKSTPLLFSRFGGFLTVSFFPFFLIFLGSECGMPFQSGKKYLPRVLSVLTSKTNSDKPDSHVIFFIFFDGSLWTYSLCFLCRLCHTSCQFSIGSRFILVQRKSAENILSSPKASPSILSSSAICITCSSGMFSSASSLSTSLSEILNTSFPTAFSKRYCLL